jgi:hypothetical protein
MACNVKMPKKAVNVRMKARLTGFHFFLPTSLRTEEHISLRIKRFFSRFAQKERRTGPVPESLISRNPRHFLSDQARSERPKGAYGGDLAPIFSRRQTRIHLDM